MLKRFFLILLILFLGTNIGFLTPVYAETAINAGDDLDNLEGDGKYLGKDYRDNYYLDIEKTDIFEAGDHMLNQIANALFSIVRILGFAVSVFFYHVMVFDVSEVFSTEINSIQSALKSSIFDSFFMLAFAASAWNLMKRVTKRDLAGLITEIGKILCIFLMASFVVTHSATALSATTSITKDISVSALMNINQQGDIAIENYASNASGMIWKSLVHAPWKSLEFEGGSDDENNVEDFLNTPPGTPGRASLVESYRGTYPNAMVKSRGVGRIGFLIVYLIPFLVKSGIYMFMAILQLAFQVMAVFYILLAPVILLLALVPSFGGIELVTLWLKKILETQVMMLIITFILGIIISLDSFLYSKSNKYGWFIVIFMETLVALVVIVNHKNILSGLSKITTSVRESGALKAQLKSSGDIFGALGSTGIKNLSPTRRYIDEMNGNGYKKTNTSYTPYSNNYQEYYNNNSIPEEHKQNTPTVSQNRYTSAPSSNNMPTTRYRSTPKQNFDLSGEQVHDNNQAKSKITNPAFSSGNINKIENQTQPIKRPHSYPIYPIKNQPIIGISQEVTTTGLYEPGNNKITKSNQLDNTDNRVVSKPDSSIKIKDKPEDMKTTLASRNAAITTNTSEKSIERPVSSVRPKKDETEQSQSVTATTTTVAYRDKSITNDINEQNKHHRPISSVPPKTDKPETLKEKNKSF